jgi:hypothetical protein
MRERTVMIVKLKVDTEELKTFLQERPGEAYVYAGGTMLAMLAGPTLDDAILVLAPPGKNFHFMSDQEINDHIVNSLKEEA